jgi:hypothetical protein
MRSPRRLKTTPLPWRCHAMYYNFRIHQTLKVSPAMAVGVTDRLWEMVNVVDMLDAFESKRGAQR